MALTPVAPTLSALTANGFQIDVNTDGNPAPPSTYYAFKVVFGAVTKFVNAGGTLVDTKVFVPALTLTVTNALPDTLHTVLLTAADDATGTNESVEGPGAAGTTLAAQPGSDAFSAIFATTVTANWTDNNNPVGTEYELDLSTDPNFLVNVINSGFVMGTSHIFTNLLPQTTYFGRVRARNSLGVFTNYTSINNVLTLTAPDTVKVIRVFNLLAERGFLITWQPNQETDLSHYRVYRSESPTDISNFKLLQDDIPKNVTSHLDKVPFTFGVVQYYIVSAVDNGDNESSLVLTTPAHENTFHSFEEQPFVNILLDSNLIKDEKPLGAIDTINVLYTTAFPFVKGSVEIWLNGNKQIPVTDFSEGPLSQQITFNDPPDTGGFLRFNYTKIG